MPPLRCLFSSFLSGPSLHLFPPYSTLPQWSRSADSTVAECWCMLLDHPIATSAHGSTPQQLSLLNAIIVRECYMEGISAEPERKDGKRQRRGGMFFSSRAPWAPAWPGLVYTVHF